MPQRKISKFNKLENLLTNGGFIQTRNRGLRPQTGVPAPFISCSARKEIPAATGYSKVVVTELLWTLRLCAQLKPEFPRPLRQGDLLYSTTFRWAVVVRSKIQI